MRILATDDEPDVLLLYRVKLSDAGHDLIEATTAAETLRLARRSRPDLILLDIALPDGDGIALLGDLCRVLAPPPPMVLVSARVGVEDQRRGLDAGAVAYVTKPFDVAELAALVAEIGASSPAELERRRLDAITRLMPIEDASPNPPVNSSAGPGGPGASMAPHPVAPGERLAVDGVDDDLRVRLRQQAAVAQLSQRALLGAAPAQLMDDIVDVLARTLSADYSHVLGCSPVDGRLVLRAAWGWPGAPVGAASVDAGRDTEAGYALEEKEPAVAEDLGTESRFGASSLLVERGMRSGVTVAVPGPIRPFGVVGVYSIRPRAFSGDDISFVQAVADVLAAVAERERAEERLLAILEAAPDAILVSDAQGRIASVNAQAQALFGYSRDELLSMSVEDLVPGSARDLHAAHRAAYSEAPRVRPMGAGLNLAGRRKDGTEVPVDIMLSPVPTGEGLVVAAVRDATERRRLDEAREAFLHAVSHELRTPLTPLLGFASLLDEGQVPPDAARDMVHRVLANAKKLDRLLSDLLDLDRLTRGTIEPIRRPTDIGELIRSQLAGFPLDRHPVTVEIEDEPLIVDVDPTQVERTVSNLLTNVVRYCPDASPVRVAAVRHDGGVLVMVDDSGPGIPDDMKQVIFEPFRRLAGGVRGTGIGLSLVARFAQLHGGRAWVEDRAGGGSSFRVLFAVAPPQCVATGHGT